MERSGQDATLVTTKDGRRIAYLEVGDPDGPLVLHNHGGPSSRLEAGLFADAARRHGVRFVGLDRSGIGRSSPQRDRTSAEWADGLVADAELLYKDWAFDVTTIERPVHMWQGTDDELVPFSVNRTIGDRMPGTVWHQVEGGGHLIAIGCADEIVAIAAEELRR